MKNRTRFSSWRKVAIIAMLAFPSLGYASDVAKLDGAKPDNVNEFCLAGSALRRDDGSIDVIITNKSPDGCDYLISNGEIVISDPPDDDQEHVIKVMIAPPMGGAPLTRVAVSAEKQNLLIADQMFRFEMTIPKKYESARIDLIELKLALCKTPITRKTIILSPVTIRFVLMPKVPSKS